MPHFIQNPCAYHPNQELTNFCTCAQCLLPVCPTCIKVHTQEHLQKGTHPQFQKLDNILIQVYESCGNILQGLQRLKQQLLEVEKVKKQNESLILEKIKLYRNKLIRQFERAITELQHQIVTRFNIEDEHLIGEIQHIDHIIEKMEHNLQSQMIALQGQDRLRAMIFNLSDNYEIRHLKELTALNERIKQMLKSNVYLQVEEHRAEDIKDSVMGYMQLGTIEWGISRPRHPSPTNCNAPPSTDLTALARESPLQSCRSLSSNPGCNPHSNEKLNSSRTYNQHLA